MDKVFIIGRDSIPTTVNLADGESLRWTLVCLPGTDAVQNIDIDINGRGCDVDIAGLYLCPAGEKLSINVRVRHNSGESVSRQLFKGIVGKGASVSFDGLIYVKKDSQKTKAYQENHTILLSEDARIETRPQLEIYADDVECSHGATTGYLNGDELFYMRSRGIPEAQARRLQIISFLAPVASRLPEELKESIYDSLD